MWFFFPAGVVFLLIAVTVAFFALATLNAWESKRGAKERFYVLFAKGIHWKSTSSFYLITKFSSWSYIQGFGGQSETRQREHGGCDQSAEDGHSSMAPDLTSYYFNFLFAPVLYFYLWFWALFVSARYSSLSSHIIYKYNRYKKRKLLILKQMHF